MIVYIILLTVRKHLGEITSKFATNLLKIVFPLNFLTVPGFILRIYSETCFSRQRKRLTFRKENLTLASAKSRFKVFVRFIFFHYLE